MSEKKKAGEQKLRLTDTPNVAQVIRIVRELERRRWERLNWFGKLLEWLGRSPDPSTPVDVVGDVNKIEAASRRRRHIDAAGNVVEVDTEVAGAEYHPAPEPEPDKPRLVQP
jgi:hypothetical protein